MPDMNIYLVGGAVRDKLLDLAVKERDWVVVGATEKQLLNQGYTRVGKDFPVFLHPGSKEEYALARTERKSGPGHTGFVCDANESVTLEADLRRRDLTINAIAETSEGKLIDPYHGIEDIQNRILRHVSEAFAEDPLRILRVARFAARFPEFNIHRDTINLMLRMVSDGALEELPAERIWAETDKALGARQPARFFAVLKQLGALERIWPEVSGIELLEKMSALTTDKAYRFAALCWSNTQSEINEMSTRLRLPNNIVEIAGLTEAAFDMWQNHNFPMTVRNDAQDIVDWLYQVDAFRRSARFHRLNDFFSKISEINNSRDNAARWKQYYEISDSISARQLKHNYDGATLGKELKSARVDAVLRSL